jgi:ferric-dicitrate binding protein FerR (iron transport regulator)
MNEEKYELPDGLSDVSHLMLKYLQKDMSVDEERMLNEWLLKSAKNKQLFDALTNDASLKSKMKLFYESRTAAEELKGQVFETTFPGSDITPYKSYGRVIIRRLAIAASFIIVASLAVYFILKEGRHPSAETTKNEISVAHDVAPGKYKAKLQLGDGSIVTLDSGTNQIIGQQGSIAVKNSNGQLVYAKSATAATGGKGEGLFNTLSTAKGETYATVLSDGSKVWLNSQSSVRYPVAFDGDVRKVEITGEAYFEVAKVKQNGGQNKPFIVNITPQPGGGGAGAGQVEVLGTHFNINSYSDEEAIKTTLLEGSVRVRSATNASEIILKPNEQAQIDKQTNSLKKLTGEDVDVDAEVAWRLGLFQFDNADLKTVMRQLQRWYDVEVVYEGNIPKREFIGAIPRSMNLSEVLKLLEKQKVHFRIEGRKIIVSP